MLLQYTTFSFVYQKTNLFPSISLSAPNCQWLRRRKVWKTFLVTRISSFSHYVFYLVNGRFVGWLYIRLIHNDNFRIEEHNKTKVVQKTVHVFPHKCRSVKGHQPVWRKDGWLVVLRFNATLTAKVISWR